MKKIRLCAFVVLLACQPVAYGVMWSGFSDGNKLLKDCTGLINRPDDNYFTNARCIGYLTGVSDTIDSLEAYGVSCIPVGVRVNQLVRVVVQYLEANPAQLHLQASSLVVSAFKQAFPCQ